MSYVALPTRTLSTHPIVLILCALLLWLPFTATAQSSDSFINMPAVTTYIDMMVKKYGFNRQYLINLFSQATPIPTVIERMNRPYEAKPWYRYRQLYVTPTREAAGIQFWQQHQAILNQAEKTYGVPASVIVAIIGVESNYGDFTGRFPTFDTLSTLAFQYPRRATFFRSELTEFLLLTRESGVDPTTISSSYAGAIGLPQFMPSSFRAYAVDFDNSGTIDLWENPADVIGSVANFLKSHGWQTDAPIAEPATVKGDRYQQLPKSGRKPQFSLSTLAEYGISPSQQLTNAGKAKLITLQDKNKPEFWLGFTNFYVITRYNPSNNYAMAVYQLSQKLKQDYHAQT